MNATHKLSQKKPSSTTRSVTVAGEAAYAFSAWSRQIQAKD